MKKQYYNQSRMRAVHHSGVKAFDNYIVSIAPGNSIGGGLYGLSIRPYYGALDGLNHPTPNGDMQRYDIKNYPTALPESVLNVIRREGLREGLYVYTLYHERNGHRTYHGFIVTRAKDNQLIDVIVTGPTYKSHIVLGYAKEYLSEPTIPPASAADVITANAGLEPGPPSYQPSECINAPFA